MRIMVLAETQKALTELCAGASRISPQVEAVLIGDQLKVVADTLWQIPAQENAMLEDYTESIAALIEQEKPELIVVEPTKRYKLIAGRIAAMLGITVITDVLELEQDLVAKRMVYGGTAIRTEKAASGYTMVMVGSGVLKTESVPEITVREEKPVPFIEPKIRLKRIAREEKEKVTIDLPGAKVVLGIGRGIAEHKDLEMVKQLALAVKGEIGCTRPIAEAEKWMPKETYLGVSGVIIAPEIYIAIGISGQIQHTVGINRSKTVVSINKEKSAPIFKQSDYGIVGDLYKVVPALIKHFG
ncbi:MAG TPA: electron transfer flavoprotein subunit alpha [Syntrophomonas sp.]|jgi:electron transfer flavoprotein alpha subunit|nr:electron transfer flavoprotein subunit alpha [Syntrophomonas sp.]HBQ87610.1 electron transfer flavoprotein subunit alpha [Syntrophomonas sp.]